MTVVEPIFKPDATAMRQHLAHLFGGHTEGWIELSWTTSTPKDGRYPLAFSEWYPVTDIDAVVERAVVVNSTPMVNVYVGAAIRNPESMPGGRSHDSDAWKLTCVYADLDDPDSVDAAREEWRTMKPSLIVCTGRAPHLRAQAYWKLDEPLQDHAAWEAMLKTLARALKGDRSVFNPGRVLRLAGSIAWPQKPGRTTEVTFIATTTSEPPPRSHYSVKTLAGFFRYDPTLDGATEARPQPISTVVTQAANPFGLPQEVITDGREGYMTQTVYAAFVHLTQELARVPTLDELFADAWRTYGREVAVNVPGKAIRGPAELREKCATLLRRFSTGQLSEFKTVDDILVAPRQDAPRPFVVGETAPPPIRTRLAFPKADTDIPPRDWVIRGLMIRRHVSLLVAPGGSGKSLLCLQLAVALSSGVSWGGWNVDRPYKVLVINAEDDADEQDRRLVASARTMGIQQSACGDRLLLAEEPENIIVARIDGKSRAVFRTPLVDNLVKLVEEEGIDVVCVDPFVETFEGDENSNMDVKAIGVLWREVARRTGCAVMLVHHTKKYAGGMNGDADASRGASALVNLVRIASTLFVMSEDEAKANGIDPEDRTKYVRFDDAKANMTLMTGKARWFEKVSVEIKNGGQGLNDQVGCLKPWSPPGPFGKTSDDQLRRALNAINRGLTDDDGKPTGEMYTAARTSTNTRRWAGTPIMDATGLSEDQARTVIKTWVASGLLVETEFRTRNGDTRKGLSVDFSKAPGASS